MSFPADGRPTPDDNESIPPDRAAARDDERGVEAVPALLDGISVRLFVRRVATAFMRLR